MNSKLKKFFPFYLLFCCTITLASSANKCLFTPDTNCNQSHLQTGWFFNKKCFKALTCFNSTYFSSKKDCEHRCALGCPVPSHKPPYEPHTLIITRAPPKGSGLIYYSYSTCGRGFILLGSSERRCNDNGNWTGKKPTCYEIVISVKHGEPKYDLGSRNILEVEEGQTVVVNCTVKGEISVNHSMVWRKVKGDMTYPLPSMHDMTEWKDKMENIYIKIDRARPKHSGEYSCMSLSNPTLSRKFTLRVKDPEKAPKMISASVMVYQTLNQIQLRCFVNGKPTPEVHWLNDGCIVKGKKLFLEGAENTMLDITITNPNCTHFGKYSCIAKNEHGSIESSKTTITAADIGLPDAGSGEAQGCTETHNESCILCPNGKAPIVKTCKGSNKTVISAWLITNKTGLSNNTFKIMKSKVLKGSNSLHLSVLKLTEQAAACDCPALTSQSWYVFTGTAYDDVFIVSERDMACKASHHHVLKLESHCKLI